MFLLKLVGLAFAFMWTLVLDNDDGGSSDDPPDEGESAPLFVARNQKDLDKKFGEEKRAAAESATTQKEQELLDRFKVSTFEDLDEKIQRLNEEDDAKKSEADKANERVTSLETEVETKQSELDEAYETIEKVVTDSQLRTELRKLNVNPEREDRVLEKEVDRKAIDVDEDGNVKGVEDEAKRIAAELPEWFGSRTKQGPPETPEDKGGRIKDKSAYKPNYSRPA